MEFVKLKNFSTRSEAEMTQKLLQEKGIKSFIQKGPYLSGALPVIPNLDTDLFVSKNDFEKAKDIIETYLQN